jgi:hypothetical protein
MFKASPVMTVSYKEWAVDMCFPVFSTVIVQHIRNEVRGTQRIVKFGSVALLGTTDGPIRLPMQTVPLLI